MGGRGANISIATKNQLSALNHYVSGEGMWINQHLRGLGDFGELSKFEKEYLADLDKITSSEFINDTLYRTVDASAIFGNISDSEYENLVRNLVYNDNQRIIAESAKNTLSKVKKEYTEKGFMSTTKDLSIAENNKYTFGSSKPVIMEIKTSKSTKGVDVMKKANSQMRQAEKYDPQKEVLLKRGQSYNVNHIGTKNGNIYIQVSMK